MTEKQDHPAHVEGGDCSKISLFLLQTSTSFEIQATSVSVSLNDCGRMGFGGVTNGLEAAEESHHHQPKSLSNGLSAEQGTAEACSSVAVFEKTKLLVPPRVSVFVSQIRLELMIRADWQGRQTSVAAAPI
jgi:hypothetical protein